MAWNRKISLSIGSSGEGLLISDLHVDFDIQKSLTFEENTAEFVIYNAQESTRNDILKVGNNLVFEAGYEDDGSGTIYIGNISESSSKKTGGDWITTIRAVTKASKSTSLDLVLMSLSYSADSLLSDILSEIATALGLVLYGKENADITLPDGFVFAGPARGAAALCKGMLESNGKSLYIDNDELVIYTLGGTPSKYEIVNLAYTSGLIEAWKIIVEESQKKEEQKNKNRIGFKCLLNYKLQVNAVVRVDSEKVSGDYIVDKLRIYGNNYGGDFNMEGEASE